MGFECRENADDRREMSFSPHFPHGRTLYSKKMPIQAPYFGCAAASKYPVDQGVDAGCQTK
jgi:hypothetical protein